MRRKQKPTKARAEKQPQTPPYRRCRRKGQRRQAPKDNIREGETDAVLRVTIQTTEGIYVEELIEDNANACPIQKKLTLKKYTVSRPPRLLREIPKFYTSENLKTGKVLEINNDREKPIYTEVWNPGKCANGRSDTRECIPDDGKHGETTDTQKQGTKRHRKETNDVKRGKPGY